MSDVQPQPTLDAEEFGPPRLSLGQWVDQFPDDGLSTTSAARLAGEHLPSYLIDVVKSRALVQAFGEKRRKRGESARDTGSRAKRWVAHTQYTLMDCEEDVRTTWRRKHGLDQGLTGRLQAAVQAHPEWNTTVEQIISAALA